MIEKTKLFVLVCAIFSIGILLSQEAIIKPVNAVSIATAVLGGTSAFSTNEHCEYVSSSAVWCPTTTGVKIWNPTTRSLVGTVNASSNISDVKCSSTHCYVWVASGTIGTLTKYTTGLTAINSTVFTGGAGSTTGHGIGLISGGGEDNIFLPIEGDPCIDGFGLPLGNIDEKGVCIWNNIAWSGARFITTSCTNDACVNYDIEWNGQFSSVGDPDANRILVKNQDSVGNHRYYLIDLSDGDTTFSTTEQCNSGIVAGGFDAQNKAVIIGGIMYDAINNDLYTFNTLLDTCLETLKSNLVDETQARGVAYSSTDDLFFVVGSTDGAIETTALYVFNGTTFDLASVAWNKILRINTTTATAGDFNFDVWVHPSEQEVHIWHGDDILIVTDLLEGAGGAESEACIDTNLDGVTDLCFTDTNGDGVADNGELGALGVYRSNANLTDFGSDVFCAFGINQDACDNRDLKTNGVGLTYLILLIIISYAFLVFIHYQAQHAINKNNVQVMDALAINPLILLVMLILDIGLAWTMGWIPDLIFYTMIVVMIGLSAFGIYRKVTSGGG